jgi:hypothetical protein
MDLFPFSARWRWVAWLLVLAAGAAIVGLDMWRFRTDLTEQMTPSDEEEARDQGLERRRALVVGRNQARVDIAWAVINERMTLIEAIEQFRALQSSRPNFLAAVPGPVWHATEDEGLASQVRLYVEQALTREPERRKAVLERLEKEWRDHSSGGVRSTPQANGP